MTELLTPAAVHVARPEGPLREPPRRLALSILLLSAALAATAAANYFRLNRLTSDQFSVGAMAQKSLEPELYARDPLYCAPGNFSFYLPWYQKGFTVLLRLGGSVGMAYWMLNCLCTAVMLAGFWLLLRSLGVRPLWAVAGAILAGLPRLSPGQEISGAFLMETALPRTLFTMMLPLVLALFFRSYGRGWRGMAAFALVGLLANAHPQSGLFMTIAFMTVMLLRDRSLGGWAAAAGGGLLSLLTVLPSAPAMLVFFSSSRGSFAAAAAASRPMAGQHAAVAVATGSRMLAWYGQISRSSGAVNVALFLTCVAPMLLAAWLARRSSGQRRSHPAAVICLRCAVVLTVVGLVGAVVYLLTPLLGESGFPMNQLRRAMRLIAPLTAVSATIWLAGAGEGVSRARRLAIVTLLLLPVAVTMVGFDHIYGSRYEPMREPARLAVEQTPVDAVFLAPPEAAEAFRVWARRAVVCAKKDLQLMPRRRHRAAKLAWTLATRAYRLGELRLLFDVARRYGADYVVIPEGWPGLPGDTGSRILAVPPASGSPATQEAELVPGQNEE